MRKWLSSLGYAVAILVGLLLLLPMLMGLFAEGKCKKIIGVINTTTPVRIDILSYKLGWFGSSALAQVSLSKLGQADRQLYQLKVTADISHGPLLIDLMRFQFAQALIRANISLNKQQLELLKLPAEAESKDIATANVKFKLSGDAVFNLESSPFAYKDQKTHFNWQGMKLSTKLFYPYNRIQTKIDLAGLDLVNNESNLHCGKLLVSYAGDRAKDGLWFGKRDLVLDSFSFQREGKGVLLSGLELRYALTGDAQNLVDATVAANVDSFSLNGTLYSQSKFALNIDKLDQVGLVKLQQQLLFGDSQLLLPTNVGLDALLSILNLGGGFNIDLSSNTKWGRLAANVKAVFASLPERTNFILAAMGSTLDCAISADKELALHLMEKFYQIMPAHNQKDSPDKLATILLNAWQKTGKITTSNEDGYLHMVVNYKDGHLLINNKQVTFSIQP